MLTLWCCLASLISIPKSQNIQKSLKICFFLWMKNKIFPRIFEICFFKHRKTYRKSRNHCVERSSQKNVDRTNETSLFLAKINIIITMSNLIFSCGQTSSCQSASVCQSDSTYVYQFWDKPFNDVNAVLNNDNFWPKKKCKHIEMLLIGSLNQSHFKIKLFLF